MCIRDRSVLLEARAVQPGEINENQVCIENDFEKEKNEMLAHFFLIGVFILFLCNHQDDSHLELSSTNELASSQNEFQNFENVEHFFETSETATFNKKVEKLIEKPKKVPCTICAKMITFTKYKLKRHMQLVHEREKLYCDECEYSAKNKISLDKHILRKHSGDFLKVKKWPKMHRCSQCDYSTRMKYNLKKHIMKHTGEKPHQCSYCKYACAQAATLRIHTRTHTGEKPFSCNECGKQFALKHHLDTHIMLHTGEKPHQCLYCTYASASKTSLINHTRTHTKEKPYSCSLCSKKFAQNNYLRGHLKSMHKS